MEKEQEFFTDANNISGINYTNMLIKKAAQKGASDIHLEPLQEKAIIKLRIDGVLQEYETMPKNYSSYIINYIKVSCNMEIGDVRVPEDGHFSVPINADSKSRVIDVRVSIFPTINGPAAVMRILNRSDLILSLDKIGFNPEVENKVKKMALSGYGMILSTGPTGSGKTTTLYSILSEINRKEKNVITLEDPVEVYFDNMRQSQIHPESGYTFAKGMKGILRQDPDIIMIGEIRDAETAELAIKASLTGVSVYSTLHANTTIGVIARFIDMNIERGLIAYSLRGVISQRLVRKICPDCSTKDKPREEFISFLGIEKEKINYKRGAGCKSCDNSGYKGRIGIFEALIFDDNLRAMIIDRSSMNDLQEYAIKSGMETLRQNVIKKVSEGITTVEEALKVV